MKDRIVDTAEVLRPKAWLWETPCIRRFFPESSVAGIQYPDLQSAVKPHSNKLVTVGRIADKILAKLAPSDGTGAKIWYWIKRSLFFTTARCKSHYFSQGMHSKLCRFHSTIDEGCACNLIKKKINHYATGQIAENSRNESPLVYTSTPGIPVRNRTIHMPG